MVQKIPADNRGNYYIKNSNGHYILYGVNGRPIYRNGVLQIRKKGTAAWKEIEAKAKKTTTSSNKTNTSNSSSNSSTNSNNNTNEEETKTVSKVEEVPITTYDEALAFAKNEWGKIRRDDGHSVEARLFGFVDIKQGTWAKVYLPSFDETMFMYITRVDHSMGSGEEWITSITLTDYPPSLSQEKETTNEDEETDEEVTASGDDD